MKSIKLACYVVVAVVCVVGMLIVINPQLGDWAAALSEESETFTPDDWSPKGPVPLPIMGEVRMATSEDTAFIRSTPEPTLFDSSSALARDTWKVIVVNQFKGRTSDTYKLDSRLLAYMSEVKSALAGAGEPTELWFLRLNRPFRENVWALPDMYRKCANDGSTCFDHYLIFAQSSLSYELEREYLSIINGECEMAASSPALAVLVVDEVGDLRYAYSPCTFGVDAKRLLQNFDYHTNASIAESEEELKNIPLLPAYSLETNTKDKLQMKRNALIRQASEGAKELSEKARHSFDEAVESWK